jgi:hypothetical protein
MTEETRAHRPDPSMEERAISGDAALLATTSLIVGLGSPVVNAWAQQHFAPKRSETPPPSSDPTPEPSKQGEP